MNIYIYIYVYSYIQYIVKLSCIPIRKFLNVALQGDHPSYFSLRRQLKCFMYTWVIIFY